MLHGYAVSVSFILFIFVLSILQWEKPRKFVIFEYNFEINFRIECGNIHVCVCIFNALMFISIDSFSFRFVEHSHIMNSYFFPCFRVFFCPRRHHVLQCFERGR